MIKVLHVITSLYTGGAERLLVNLLPLLRDSGNQVDLLLFNGIETPFKKELLQKGIKVYSLSMKNDVYNPCNLYRVWWFLKKHRYDIIHTHNTACQLFVPLSQISIRTESKLVTTEHSSFNRRRSMWWIKPLDKWMYNRYASIVCIGDKSYRNLSTYIGKSDSLITISNGVDTGSFIRPIKQILPGQQIVITMVAALRVEKDHRTVLKAMLHLPDNYRLQFIGSGPQEHVTSVKCLCSELGLDDRVTFMGVRQDVSDILEQSDVVVLSSHWEGLSLSSIEGMASGRPFVASDVDGLREMVGGSGVLFEHGNDKDLAEKIQWLCEHPDEYRKVAQRCQEKARQYDISITAEKYLDLYHQVLNS